jgi:hypothetical protein
MTTRAKRDPGPCSFCGHPYAIHTGNDTHKTGCAAPKCPQTPTVGESGMRVGRCAVYTSAAQAARAARWFANAERPVTVTANELAKTIHLGRYGNRDHSAFSSCSCTHEAMALLGFNSGLRGRRS